MKIFFSGLLTFLFCAQVSAHPDINFAAPKCLKPAKEFFFSQAPILSEKQKRFSRVEEGLVETFPTPTAGRWIEKHLFLDGRIEIHVVSFGRRARHFWNADCAKNLVESLSTQEMSQTGFTDLTLKNLLRQNPRGIIYLWSPRMTLSVSGVRAVQRAAVRANLPVTFLVDPQAGEDESRRVASVSGFAKLLTPAKSFDLTYRGGTLHYPSVFYYFRGKLRGPVILGNRGEQGYARLFADWQRSEGTTELAVNVNFDGRLETDANKQLAVTRPVDVSKVSELPGRSWGLFAKPVFGTRWMGMHHDWADSYFFNLDTGAAVNTGYTNDTYVTPHDHRYGIFWGTATGLLGIAEFDKMLVSKVAPLFLDQTMHVHYQSVGTLTSGEVASQYRVITGNWNGALSSRDYEIIHRTSTAAPRVQPLSPVRNLCVRSGINTAGVPIVSKDGREIVFNLAGATVIYGIDDKDPQVCTRKETLPQTGKAAFSFDGRYVSFRSTDAGYVYDREAQTLYELTGLSETTGAGMASYPEFQEDGTMVTPFVRQSDGKQLIVEFDPNL